MESSGSLQYDKENVYSSKSDILENAAGDQAKFLSLMNKTNVDELGKISKMERVMLGLIRGNL